jgi:hypothetical protein
MNFKLEKLRKYDGKENPKNWITLYEITIRLASGDEHVMANYLPVVLDQAGHQWLLSLPENSSTAGHNSSRPSSTTSSPRVINQAISTTSSAYVTTRTSHCATTCAASRICATRSPKSLMTR